MRTTRVDERRATFHPLEDPESGSSIVTRAGDDPDGFLAAAQGAFERAIGATTVQVGDAYRIRENGEDKAERIREAERQRDEVAAARD